jgi:hypothetical protein
MTTRTAEAPAAPAERAVPAGLGALIVAIAGIAAAVLPLLRQRGVHSWDGMWAEDGAVYLNDALRGGGVATLFRGYAGYTVLVPRALALPSVLVPAAHISVYANLAAATAGALVAIFVYFAMAPTVHSSWLRASVAAACVLGPCLVYENTGVITNVPWVLGFAAFWAIVSEARGRAMTVARAVVVFAAMTSSPLPGLFAPLAIAIVYRRRRTEDVTVFAAFVVGGIVQLIGIVTTTDHTPKHPSSLKDFVLMYPVRVIGSYLIGDRFIDNAWIRFGWLFGVVATVALVAILLVVTKRGALLVSWPALVALGYSVVFLVVPIYIRGTEGMRLVVHTFNPYAPRYVVIPVLLLISALAIWIDATGWRWLTLLFAVHMAVVISLSFSLVNLRSPGPAWPAGVRDARRTCADPAVGAASVPISPFGWYAPIPCSKLR